MKGDTIKYYLKLVLFTLLYVFVTLVVSVLFFRGNSHLRTVWLVMDIAVLAIITVIQLGRGNKKNITEDLKWKKLLIFIVIWAVILAAVLFVFDYFKVAYKIDMALMGVISNRYLGLPSGNNPDIWTQYLNDDNGIWTKLDDVFTILFPSLYHLERVVIISFAADVIYRIVSRKQSKAMMQRTVPERQRI